MKSFVALAFALAIIVGCNYPPEKEMNAETQKRKDTIAMEEKQGYDSVLAKQLGADEYGMKQYVMAFLKRGPNRSRDTAESDKLQKAHLQNIMRMADEGKLVIAGPFFDDWEVRGIYIFNTASVDTAKQWTSTDPAIQAGSLVMELHPWYGSAGLMKVNEIHKQVEKKNVAD
jgi:uncharacterized protein